MAIPNLLMQRYADTNVQVWNTIGGVLDVQIGNNVTALQVVPNDGNLKPHNRVVEFKNKFYTIGRTAAATTVRVCEKDTGGAGTWGAVFTSASAAEGSNADNFSGLYMVHDGSDQLLCFFYRVNTTTTVRICTSNDGTSWSETAALSAGGITKFNALGLTYQNTVFIGSDDTEMIQVDPVAGSVTTFTGQDAPRSGALVVFRDTLYLVHDTGLEISISDFTGSGFSFNSTIHSASTWTTRVEGQMAAWADDSNIHVIGTGGKFSGGATDGQGSHKYTLTPTGSTFSTVNVTNPVIPSIWRPERNNDTGDVWYVYVSTDTDPTAPEVFLWFIDNDGRDTGAWTLFRFTDDLTELSSVSGPSVDYAPPTTQFGSGEHINKGSGNRADIETSVAGSGGFDISIRVYGILTGQVLRVYYSTDQHAPNMLATLLSVSGGAGSPVLNANKTQIDSVDGDDGATILTVFWDMDADGVSGPDSSHFQANITAS